LKLAGRVIGPGTCETGYSAQNRRDLCTAAETDSSAPGRSKVMTGRMGPKRGGLALRTYSGNEETILIIIIIALAQKTWCSCYIQGYEEFESVESLFLLMTLSDEPQGSNKGNGGVHGSCLIKLKSVVLGFRSRAWVAAVNLRLAQEERLQLCS
jgi:hypothetical protein